MNNRFALPAGTKLYLADVCCTLTRSTEVSVPERSEERVVHLGARPAGDPEPAPTEVRTRTPVAPEPTPAEVAADDAKAAAEIDKKTKRK